MPGERFPVSDVVVRGELSAELRRSLEPWPAASPGTRRDPSRPVALRTCLLEAGVDVTRFFDAQDLAANERCRDSPATHFGFADLTASGGRLGSAIEPAVHTKSGRSP